MDFATEKREYIQKLKESFFVTPTDEQLQNHLDFIRLRVPAPAKEFNKYGLLYQPNFVFKIGYNLLAYPFFIQADFACKNTVSLVKNKHITIDYVDNFDTVYFYQITAIAVGDLAYIIQNCNDVKIKEKAKSVLLNYVVNFYQKKLTPELLQLAKNPFKTGTKLN